MRRRFELRMITEMTEAAVSIAAIGDVVVAEDGHREMFWLEALVFRGRSKMAIGNGNSNAGIGRESTFDLD